MMNKNTKFTEKEICYQNTIHILLFKYHYNYQNQNSRVIVYPQNYFPVKLKENALAYTFPFHNILWVWFTARL